MKVRVILLLLGLFILAGVRVTLAEEEEKPLGPGWLSLDSTVGVVDNAIANGKSNISKSLFGINFGGYLDTAYQWSSNWPSSPSNISGHYFDKDQNKIDFNDFHFFIDKPEKDWGVGFHVSGDFGRTGELLREATFWHKNLEKAPSAELREAYLTTTIPVGEGIGFKGGIFVTPLGTEILPNPGAFNDNISRSFLFNYAIPLRHLGGMFSYSVLKTVSLSAGLVTGWDQMGDLNSSPSFLGGVTVTPNDKFTFVSNLIAGDEPTFTGPNPRRSTFRWVLSNVWTIKPLDPMGISLEYTFGRQNDGSLGGTRDATWQGVAGIVSWAWTDRFTTALRSEFFSDRDGARLGGSPSGHADVKVGEFTLTGAYKFTKMLLGRIELRQDFANNSFYRRGSISADKNQTYLAAQATYSF